MALVAVKPSSCFLAQRPALGFGRGRQFGVARVVVALPALRRRFPSLRCSVEEGAPEVPEKNPEKPEVAENGVPSEAAAAPVEEFGGWSEVASDEPEPEGSWKAGVSMDPILYFLKIDLAL